MQPVAHRVRLCLVPIEYVISYDMRAPDFGARPADLYAAALDQVAWADQLGFHSVGLGEHHCSPDGYNPSPIVLACAMAGRTRQIRFRTRTDLPERSKSDQTRRNNLPVVSKKVRFRSVKALWPHGTTASKPHQSSGSAALAVRCQRTCDG